MKDLPPVTLAGGGAGPEASRGGGGMLTQIQIWLSLVGWKKTIKLLEPWFLHL